MAKRILKAQLKPVACIVNAGIDRLVTKQGLAMTPAQVKELTDKGISVSLPNEKQFLEPTPTSNPMANWDIDPVFCRDTSMCEVWELERNAQTSIAKAHKTDKRKFG